MEKCTEKERRQKEIFPDQSRIPSRQFLDQNSERFFNRLGVYLARRAERLGIWTYNFVRLHWLGIINFHLLIFVLGALEAPLLLHLDQQWLSKIVYGFYSLFCHQDASRSLFIFENQMAICARCLGFYSSVLIYGLWISLKRTKPLDLKLGLILALPATTDVFLQILHIQESTNLIRITTGSLLGLAVSLYLFPRAQKALERLTTERSQISENQVVRINT